MSGALSASGRRKRQVAAVTAFGVTCLASPALAQEFSFAPPGELLPGSGTGRVDSTVYAPGIRYPIEKAPSFANSQVWGHGGGSGPGGSQCDAANFSYPWRDNYCETRQWDMPLCPAGTGHQGQDIRAATCDNNTHWAVAAVDGTITNVGSYSVYLTGADGTRFDYLHMSNVQVAFGHKVVKGQRLGHVSNKFNGTPTTVHLHLNIRQYVQSLGAAVYVPPYMSLVKAYEGLVGPVNKPPIGYLDRADCDGIGGWAQDPDAKDKAIDVHVYLDSAPGDAKANAIAVKADEHRDDLCDAIGSCKHAFTLPLPYSFADGEKHTVNAYGIDTAGGNNPALKQSPRELVCALALPKPSVRRPIANLEVFGAWAFSWTFDVLTLPDGKLEPFDVGDALPTEPRLVRAEGEADAGWLIDGSTRRRIADEAVASAWRFNLGDAEELTDKELESFTEGPPLRKRPLLVKGSSATVYVLDAPPIPNDATTSSAEGAGGAAAGAGGGFGGGIGGSGGAGTLNGLVEGRVGCACRAGLGGTGSARAATVAMSAWLALRAARRRRRRA